MNEPASYPDGFFCGNVPPEPICLPTCEARECPEGPQCVRHEDGVSQGTGVYGPFLPASTPVPRPRPPATPVPRTIPYLISGFNSCQPRKSSSLRPERGRGLSRPFG